MNEDILVKIALAVFSIAFSIAGYFMRRTIENLEVDNKELHKEMARMKENYIDRFEELKDLQTKGMAEIMRELATGSVIFAQIRSDVDQIKRACTYIPRPPHT